MFVFLHEVLLKVTTPFIWSLKPYCLAVSSSLIQCSCLILRMEVGRFVRTVHFLKNLHSHVNHRMGWLMEMSVEKTSFFDCRSRAIHR